MASQGRWTSTVQFERIWWDKHAKHPSITKVSFWRAIAPPGYAALGDCMVAGAYHPPAAALVVREDTSDEGSPLLKQPLKFVLVRS